MQRSYQEVVVGTGQNQVPAPLQKVTNAAVEGARTSGAFHLGWSSTKDKDSLFRRVKLASHIQAPVAKQCE